MFLSELYEHLPKDRNIPVNIFVDSTDKSIKLEDRNFVFYYDSKEKYRNQFVSCIRHVLTDYCIYISEDYILYDEPRWDKIFEYVDVLERNKHLSFIRLNKGGVVEIEFPKYKGKEDLFQLSNVFPYFYTNQAAVWRTRDLEKIHVRGPNLHIAGNNMNEMFEPAATKTCQQLGIQGLFCYHGEPKRGRYHYDTSVFPHIATALVKGKWNISEYREELPPLLEKYGIDPSIRGVR